VTRDPASGLFVAIAPARDAVLILNGDGAEAGRIVAPPGYALSHFLEEPARLLVVGQGEAVIEGWPDWHFEVDVANACLIRAGPAY
jgi:hypothetical protein